MSVPLESLPSLEIPGLIKLRPDGDVAKWPVNLEDLSCLTTNFAANPPLRILLAISVSSNRLGLSMTPLSVKLRIGDSVDVDVCVVSVVWTEVFEGM